MELLPQFIQHIKDNGLFTTKDKLFLAVSGGVDSIVLCELCKKAGYDFSILHCNFQLRGEESERDEQFVRALGKKYGVEIMVKRFETEKCATENKISVQEAARDLRYKWFFDLWQEKMNSGEGILKDNSPGWKAPDKIPFVVTAHHADDNIETILMNFFRGTGLHGLTGIPVKGPSEILSYIRRPLLPFSKEQLHQFARDNKLTYVEDSSNLSSKYTRNFFRNELIPAIAKVYPQVKGNLQDNIKRFSEIEKLYQLSVDGIIKKICRVKGEEVHIPVKQLMQFSNRALIYEIISRYGFSEKQIEELIKLAASESGHYIQSPDELYRIIKHRHWFIISPVRNREPATIVIEEGASKVQLGFGQLSIQTIPVSPSAINQADNIACLDLNEIKFPLLLRRWKTGDYFYPLGMRKKKKLARFFIDQKLSVTEKEKVWVLESANRIVWVMGRRIDDRFKITPKTRRILHLSLSK